MLLLMLRIILPSLLLLCTFKHGSAAVFTIGPNQFYTSPNALYTADVVGSKDTVEILEGTYTGRAALAVWQADSLLIRGVGEQPQLYAEGQYILGKGIWVLAGNGITVENIGFHDAVVPDRNGAGIRLDGEGMTIRHCLFRNNEDGILTSNPGIGDILIEYSEFDGNGHGDGLSHNLYVGTVGSLTFRFNYSHHANVGHCLKSRAKENNIRYNRFSDEETGNSSRLIDLPNGGQTFIVGNVCHQGPAALNRNVIGYGHEGFFNAAINDIYVGNNTFVNHRLGVWTYVDARPGTEAIWVVNNILSSSESTTIAGVVMFELGNIRLNEENIGFVDATNYDYRLIQDSPAVDASVTDFDGGDVFLPPVFEYVHPLAATTRPVIGSVDVGAYEFKGTVATSSRLEQTIRVGPNPTTGYLHFIAGGDKVKYALLSDLSGRELAVCYAGDKLDLSRFPAGMYLLRCVLFSGEVVLLRVIRP